MAMHEFNRSKRYHSKNSLGRGYGSAYQNDRAKRKTLWATKNKDKLLKPNEISFGSTTKVTRISPEQENEDGI
jgi:hypothetical protein